MPGKHCKLYDENLVHNIMLSTGMSLYEYMKQNKKADIDDICEFVELNAGSIIENTIEDMNSSSDFSDNFDDLNDINGELGAP
ncbi:MAG: hypothetical protein GF398_15685 [Chitinivibrionales bacterium]|nr:hypothetical protein [Chitinivibrionales bacterium]